MKNYRTEGIVIKRRNFGEADRIITIFTKRSGKLQVKAPGVRRITSRRSSHIELLNCCIFGLYEGKKYPIVTEVESSESFSNIKNNLGKIGVAYHLCELVDGLCAENQENMLVFSLLKNALEALSSDETDADKLIAEFEIKLLNILGFYRGDYFPKNFNRTAFIEQILERRLKSRQISIA